ncbi:MAG TPA: hypothetical protein DCP92_11825 [Nitrospiraceae bacterium]|jgi:hypothetical protein|nr:hypothetical protein [Nitrospiraceae bacterium]
MRKDFMQNTPTSIPAPRIIYFSLVMALQGSMSNFYMCSADFGALLFNERALELMVQQPARSSPLRDLHDLKV